MVVNYDIPWNPVRVIQRVGRINRISKKVFNRLFIVNFFPTEKGSEYVKSREIAQNKMFLIHNVLGEDSKIFDIDEEPTAAGLYDKLQQNPDEMEQESFYTKVLNEYIKIDKANPGLIESLSHFPKRVKVAKSYKDNELLVFFQKGRLYSYGVSSDDSGSDQPYQIMIEDAFDKICCKKEEKRLPLSKTFWENYEKVKNYREYQVAPLSDQSLEQRAINNIKSILQHPWSEVMPHIDFVRVLLEDILSYGTLSDYTLRRLANLEVAGAESGADVVLELAKIRTELGDDYLQKEKGRQTDVEKEVIIAIENQHYE